MPRVLAVFGATGQQGGSIIDYILNDAALSKDFKLRAITRDVGSDKAHQLKQKVEVVHGDVSDPASLETALTGAHTVFAMTTPNLGPDGLEAEYNTGKAIADAAVQQGLEYIIFSTLPSPKDVSGGKYDKVQHFESKAKIEQYIRSLPIKSAFISPGFFMQNFEAIPFLAPQKAEDGTWVLARPNASKAELPMIDAVGDTGKWVGAILAEPEKFEGNTFCAATALYSLEDVARIISKATGKTVVHKEISVKEFESALPFGKEVFPGAFKYPEDFGYYGPHSRKLVAWAAENAREKVTTLEEYLQKHPLKLE